MTGSKLVIVQVHWQRHCCTVTCFIGLDISHPSYNYYWRSVNVENPNLGCDELSRGESKQCEKGGKREREGAREIEIDSRYSW